MLKKKFFKTKAECEVTFEFDTDEASHADLVCEVNGWQPIRMKKVKKGPFRMKMRFPKDERFQFRYLVDDTRWINDAEADEYAANGMGDSNGVLDTAARA
jgi:1,4-alpha-glucan branching enzyme